MLSPLTSIEVYPRALGSELVIWWVWPGDTPEGSIVYLFKSTSALTDEQIVAYFTSGMLPEGVSLEKYDYTDQSISDFDVIDGTTYHYTAVLASLNDDDTLDEYSTAVRTTGVPACSFKYDGFHPTKLVFEYIRDHLLPKMGVAGVGWKDNKDVFLDYASSPFINKYPAITVSTGNEMQTQQYFGDFIDKVKKALDLADDDEDDGEFVVHEVEGEMVSQIVNIQFAAGSYEQRDTMRYGFESMEIAMDNWICGKGALEFDMKYIGDGEVFGESARLYTGGFTIIIVYEKMTYVPDTDRLDEIEIGSVGTYEEE